MFSILQFKHFLTASITAMLLLNPISLSAATNTAQIRVHNDSIVLHPARILFGGSQIDILFTTYDGNTAAFPLNDSGEVSLELKPLAPGNNVYYTDYITLEDGSIDDWGYIKWTFPTTDSDGDGLINMIDIDNSVSVSITGYVYSKDPNNNTTVTGVFTRQAGSSQGTFSGNFYDAYYKVNIPVTITWELIVYTGTLTYDNVGTGDLSISMTSKPIFGVTETVSNTIPLNRLLNGQSFTLNRTIFGSTMTLDSEIEITLNNGVYSGTASVDDGFGRSSWSDYKTFHIEITDPNDWDGDSIPDLTDHYTPSPTLRVDRCENSKLYLNCNGTVSGAVYTVSYNTNLNNAWTVLTTALPGNQDATGIVVNLTTNHHCVFFKVEPTIQ